MAIGTIRVSEYSFAMTAARDQAPIECPEGNDDPPSKKDPSRSFAAGRWRYVATLSTPPTTEAFTRA